MATKIFMSLKNRRCAYAQIIFLCMIGLPFSVLAGEVSKDQIKKILPSSWVDITIEECRFTSLHGTNAAPEVFWCIEGTDSETLPGTLNFRIYSKKIEMGKPAPLYKLAYRGGGMQRYEDPLLQTNILITGCSTGLCLDAVAYKDNAFKTVLHWEGQTGQNDPRLRIMPSSKTPSPIIIQTNNAGECQDTDIYTWSTKKSAYVLFKETCWEKRGEGKETVLGLQ
jgi:hypothetical protein